METFSAKTIVVVLAVILGTMFITGIGNPQKQYQGKLAENHKTSMDQITATPNGTSKIN